MRDQKKHILFFSEELMPALVPYFFSQSITHHLERISDSFLKCGYSWLPLINGGD